MLASYSWDEDVSCRSGMGDLWETAHGSLGQSAQGWTLRHRPGYLLAAVSRTPG